MINKKPPLAWFLSSLLMVLSVFFIVGLLQLTTRSNGLEFTLAQSVYVGMAALSVINTYLCFQVSPLIRKSFFIQMGFGLLASLTLVWQGYLFSNYEISLLATSIVLPLLLFLDQRLNFILSHPHLRMWRVARRHRIPTPIYIGPFCSEGMNSETFDLSETGAFIRFKFSQSKQAKLRWRPGEKINIRLTLGPIRQLRFSGRIARKNTTPGRYPEGFAVQFEDLDREQKKFLKSYLSQSCLDAIAS